ncbi:MAG: fructosamine kinase family protein, partial [Gammaproteobacteria bacterium]|nr:fructosamine kinase family protein [Gammaproteobacteria bacterium]
MSIWNTIQTDIENATGIKSELNQQGSVSGGCINQAMRVQYGDVAYFVKLNSASQVDMFEAEAQGLLELKNSKTLRVPEPVCWGENGQQAYLVMENLQMGGPVDPVALGAGLA